MCAGLMSSGASKRARGEEGKDEARMPDDEDVEGTGPTTPHQFTRGEGPKEQQVIFFKFFKIIKSLFIQPHASTREKPLSCCSSSNRTERERERKRERERESRLLRARMLV